MGAIQIIFGLLFLLLIGLLFIYIGYLIFTGKAPTLLDYFLKQGISYEDKLTTKFFGTIIIILGIIILISPFIFGIGNMNF